MTKNAVRNDEKNAARNDEILLSGTTKISCDYGI